MFKRIFKVGLCSILATNMVMSSFFYTKVLKPMGVREVDVVSHASTMAPPPVPSLRPGRGEGEDKGTEVSESDKNLHPHRKLSLNCYLLLYPSYTLTDRHAHTE